MAGLSGIIIPSSRTDHRHASTFLFRRSQRHARRSSQITSASENTTVDEVRTTFAALARRINDLGANVVVVFRLLAPCDSADRKIQNVDGHP